MKETPLFFAVKNESKECAELLLTWGANSEVLNLRRQRAIDLATSQDMRYTLLNPTTVSLINHAFPNQHKCTALVLTDEDTTTTTERNVNSSAKAAVCKYFDAHRGCVRGAKCFYAQCEEESRRVKEGVDQSYSFATKLLKHKAFVGGLPPSVDSDDLRKFCEQEFGSVEDAIVIVTQIENKIQSRGFVFVTFRQEKSASKAMRAHYITMRGKTVEIKSLIPKLVLGAEFEKMSPQQEQKNFFQFLEEKSNEDIMEGDNPEQGSWADRLVHGQPTVSSTEPQVTKSSEDPSTPTWLKVYKKWFPVFLRGLSNHPNYALSSLKADFRAKFALELDHSSVGYSKLSDFLVKPFSNLCTVEILPISKGGTSTHMILRPKVSRPKHRLLPTLGAPHNLSLSALIVNGGDSKCHQGLSVDNVGYSECLQNLTIDTCSDTKCLQDLTDDSTVDSQFLEDLSLHGQDSRVFKGIVQKVKGTTCIGWVFEDYVLLGADSRSTFEGEIVTDTRRKLRKLTPLIGATYAGDGSQTSETFAYMKRKMSDDILTGKDVNSVENLGNLCQERNLIDKELAFQFLIGGIQNKVPKCCFVYNNKGSRGLEWVDKCKAIGSGGVHITEMLKGLCLKFGDKAPWEDMVFVVVYLLAIAALDDPCTGGILSARQLGKEHNMGDLCLTVIEVIIRFYTTEHSYLTCGVEKTQISFQHSEHLMIFLFYKCDEIDSEELQTWLSIGKKKKISKRGYGHPLTELVDDYHAHRVEFKSSKARDKFFREAKTPNKEMSIPFTSSRQCFRYYELNNHIIFVACQTLDMLESLKLSARMKEQQQSVSDTMS